MKIITLHQAINNNELFTRLREKLNPMFKEQRQQEIVFDIYKNGEAVEIAKPDLYEGALFSIAINGQQLWITRNEHYTDDVNSLTIESILASLFEDLTDDIRGVEMVQEG